MSASSADSSQAFPSSIAGLVFIVFGLVTGAVAPWAALDVDAPSFTGAGGGGGGGGGGGVGKELTGG
ncbi:hypothetical protein AALO_G00112640 [Alosa alosa]|uniref:Uncharacterized protein n=1 Tax=Alosa alosa TaxID=278164 RepID=A0AAV6GTK0_9TELE|nr:hypothetical protein AALO_G00112640 [Alosa alosa]